MAGEGPGTIHSSTFKISLTLTNIYHRLLDVYRLFGTEVSILFEWDPAFFCHHRVSFCLRGDLSFNHFAFILITAAFLSICQIRSCTCIRSCMSITLVLNSDPDVSGITSCIICLT
jgi:hypothetical protein